MSPTPLPDPGDCSGRERPFSTAMLGGQPFPIMDAISEFGVDTQVALLIQLIDDRQRLVGETFVWTKHASPSRLKLVDLVQRSADGVGPCQVKLIEQSEPGRKPFQHIVRYSPDDSEPAREPARAQATQAAEQEVDDPDDIEF